MPNSIIAAMNNNMITKEQIELANENSITASGAARFLGVQLETYKRHAKKYGLYKTNQSGKGIKKQNNTEKKIEDILSGKVLYDNGTSTLRKRLINGGYIENKCGICGIYEWNGKSLTLELDHVDGNKYNNIRENLRILCPNCHSQTETFGRTKNKPAKNIDKKGKTNRIISSPKKEYTPKTKCICGQETKNKKYCSSECVHNGQRWANRPTKEQLEQDIKTMSWLAIGKKYGVSDNAARKWAKKLEIFYKKRTSPIEEIPCKICGNPTKNQKYCSNKCRGIAKITIKKPSKEQLMNDISNNISSTKMGEKYGVHHVTILRWIKEYKNGSLDRS